MKTKKVLKTIASLTLVIVMVVATALGQFVPAGAAKAPKFNKKTISLSIGKETKVVIQNYVKGSKYKWSVKNSKIATLRRDKKPIKAYVKGKKSGKTTLNCRMKTPKGKTFNLKSNITVIAVPTNVAISAPATTVNVDGTITLKATVTPSNAATKLTWSTSKADVATVSSAGVVTGKSAGETTITVKTTNGKKASVNIKVQEAPIGPGSVLWEQKEVIVKTYNSYKYDANFIWLMPYNYYYDGADKDVGKANDVRGRTLRMTGQFKMDGPDAAEVLLQANYTRPANYPVAKKFAPVKSGEWYTVDLTFVIPKDAVNGDTDDNGKNWPILTYFANRPDKKFIYKVGNDFTFRNFKITVVK